MPSLPFVLVPRAARRAGALLLCATALALTAGCGSDSIEKSIKFESTPPGATVNVDGTPVGKTPMTAMLGRRRDTKITFIKTGFEPATEMVRAQGNTLIPNPVKVTLQPENLPASRGANPQEELEKRLRIVRQQVATGQISAEDQAYIETILIQYYTGPGAPPSPPPSKESGNTVP